MKKKLFVLSFGAGQDSTYILYRILRDSAYRASLIDGDFIVVMCDTGDEHPKTYEHVKYVQELCLANHIEFYFLTADQGFHPNTWQTLTGQFRKNNSIMSLAFPRSCTDNLKIRPFYNFLNVYIGRKYYGQSLPNSTRNKTWIKRFASENGKINIILGIASGEEKRVKLTKNQLKAKQLDLFKPAPKNPLPNWMLTSVQRTYPMITDGIDRKKAQDYILATPWNLPPPSNCMRCPFLSKPEILWLYRFHPATFREWVQMEKAKINKEPDRSINLGVKGEKMLDEILAEAIAEFGHWTNEELEDYKMSHGHCVMSKY